MLTPSPTELKTKRKEARLTQREAAELVHSSREAWAQWELGKNKIPLGLWELFLIKVAKHVQ